MTNSPLKHVVFVAGPGWGHLRPALKFATRTVEKFPNTFVSMFVHGPQAPKALDYLTTQSPFSRERVRVVPSVPAENPSGAPLEASLQISSPLDLIADMGKYFDTWILNELKVTGLAVNGRAIEPPSWILEDHINGGIALAGNDLHRLPVVSWWLGPAVSLISHVGNTEHGHGGRLLESVAAAYKRDGSANGKTFEEIYHQELTNRLVCIPGLPAHYEHEQIPQMLPFLLPFVAPMMERWAHMLENVTSMVICSTYEMEPIAAETFTNAFSKVVTPYFIGPAVDPPSKLAKTTATGAKASTSPVTQFLDRAYTDLGAHSVVYVAFGTTFFPMPQSIGHLAIILEEIIAHGYRLIFALSSAAAKLTGLNTQFIEKVTAAGQAIFPSWTEQADVLEHPAIHYFLSHGGWNSTIESVVRGVPMIFWPFGADQPTNTMQIATQQGCGFELLQVRTGPAKSVAHQQYSDVIITGTDEAVRDEIKKVLKMSKGSKGDQQRRSTKALGKVFLDSLSKGGSGDMSLGRFGELLGLSSD